jgi:coenzyme F420-dependent glucose-6-phosphate dehydrogenase
MEIGYALSSEEHAPLALVENAVRAEQAGFPYAFISDHFHPWTDSQGHAAFVWGAIGAIAARTERMRVGTGVTCPLIRTHPAIVAHAAATSATLMPGRFFLGLGTGENLNEHVTGARWPAPDERIAMLEEAIEAIRQLWQGGVQTYEGSHYRVDHARIYDLPDDSIQIVVAAAKPNAAELAARLGDGLVSTSPDAEVLEAYTGAGGDGPVYGQLTVCWADSAEAAVETALEAWPNSGIPGRSSQELPMPEDFEAVAELVTAATISEQIVCGPDPDRYLEGIREFADAGFTHVYLHQVGADQKGCFRFYERELQPRLEVVESRA